MIEMKGKISGKKIYLTTKDKNDPSDGSYWRAYTQLTNDWKTYEIETSKFKTANKKT